LFEVLNFVLDLMTEVSVFWPFNSFSVTKIRKCNILSWLGFCGGI